MLLGSPKIKNNKKNLFNYIKHLADVKSTTSGKPEQQNI